MATNYISEYILPAVSSPGDIRANPPVLMNEREVSLFVGVCPRSVRNFTARKLLPVIRLGRRRLYRRDAVLAALKELEQAYKNLS